MSRISESSKLPFDYKVLERGFGNNLLPASVHCLFNRKSDLRYDTQCWIIS